MELHGNPSSESQHAACGRTDTTKLTVAFILFIYFLRTRTKTEGTPGGPTKRHVRTTAPEFTLRDG